MTKLTSILVAGLFAVSMSAQTTNTTSTANNAAVAGINQTFQSEAPTTGRLFVNPVQPYQAPVLPYLGPWSTGSNIIDDLRLLPERITADQAKMMYNGGVSAHINKMADGSYQFKECKLLTQLPLKKIIQDGKEAFVPDDSRFERKAFIFLQGNKNATTVDVVAKAVIEALDNGANAIFLMKKVTGQATSSTGWGLGIGYVSGGLNGAEMNQAQAASGGTGFNHATAKPVYTEGMVVLALKEINPIPVAVVVPAPVIAPAPVVIHDTVVVHDPAPSVSIVVEETSLHFFNGKASLTPEGVNIIKKLADGLKGKTGYVVIVSGFTSAVGSTTMNEELSKQRAAEVANALVAAGVSRNAIKQSGKTDKEHPSNRRVEIEVITTK